jgi:hypothetical protein
MEIYQAPTEDAARALILESDAMRKKYFAAMTKRE